ncbi:hypothetical protein [Massilia endophytica]|uniref:hypothetical protein n=1 Tax=Massilia endophytica TaxID=2899220 RepID=UPI001E47BA5A|nr:hypothetical protein [Massilia endophytica]UGQ47444.1 hypothetical protein LSQ66_02900 [Massilia endophytica]
MLSLLYCLMSGTTALLAALCFFFSYLSYDTGFHQIRGQEGILIAHAKGLIDAYRSHEGRLPESKDLLSWMERDGFRCEGIGCDYRTKEFAPKLTELFGKAPADAYTFSFWTGEVFVTYASWQEDAGYLSIDDLNYTFGVRNAAVAVWAFVGMIFVTVTGWVIINLVAPFRSARDTDAAS